MQISLLGKLDEDVIRKLCVKQNA